MRNVAGKAIIHTVDQGPWGKPKGSGGNGGGWTPNGGKGRGTPPKNFDALLEELKQHFHNLFGEENGNRGIIAALIVFFLLWLASGIYQLQPGQQGVVLHFGKFDRITSSGLRYHLPAPFESVEIVNSESVRNVVLGGDPTNPPHGGSTGTGDDEILMLTGDENIINLSFSVQWKVRDAKDFVFSLPNPEQTVRDVAESAMREVIGRTPIESALTEGKSKVQEEARKLTQDTLDSYHAGIQILQVDLLDAGFPQAVVDAARDVQAARADEDRARNEAEAYTNDILPRARGQAAHIVQDAEAYKQEVVAHAEGEAARFNSVYAQYKLAEDVTRKRIYLETMEKILKDTNKVILDTKTGVVPYLPLPEVKSPQPQDSAPKDSQ
jgi:membrane protease subunit HflK